MNFLKELITLPKSAVKQSTWVDAYGSDEKKILRKMGIQFLDKPSNFGEIRAAENAITEDQLEEIRASFEEEGIDLPTYDKKFILKRPQTTDGDSDGCLGPAQRPPADIFILTFPDSQNSYLVDRSDSADNISSWIYITK